jgi:hypothetical protein
MANLDGLLLRLEDRRREDLARARRNRQSACGLEELAPADFSFLHGQTSFEN